MVFDIRAGGGGFVEISHVIPLLTLLFLIPFLVAISITIDDAALGFSSKLMKGFASMQGAWAAEIIIAGTIMIAFYIFIWAFCRSFYIISLLDSGIWSKSPLFSRILEVSTIRERYCEAFLRGLIVFFFLNHQIVIADALGAHLTEFYGMERDGCHFANMPWTSLRLFLESLPHAVTGNPVSCGLANTVSSAYNEIMRPDGAGGPEVPGEQIRIVAISSIFVLGSILLWSFRTAGLYKKYCRSRDDIEFCTRSMREFSTQRWACGYAALSSIFMFVVGGSADSGMGMAWAITLFALVVIWFSGLFLLIVLRQIFGVINWRFRWVRIGGRRGQIGRQAVEETA